MSWDKKRKDVLDCIAYHIEQWGEVPPDSMIADMTFCSTQYVGRVKQGIGIKKQKMGDIRDRKRYKINKFCEGLRLGILTENPSTEFLVRGVMIDIKTYTSQGSYNVLDNECLDTRGYKYLLYPRNKDKWIMKEHLLLLLHYLLHSTMQGEGIHNMRGLEYTKERNNGNGLGGNHSHTVKKEYVGISFMDIVVWRSKERKLWRQLLKDTLYARRRMGLE